MEANQLLQHLVDYRLQIRSIIPARNKVNREAPTVRFSLMPDKVFLFKADTEERIPVDAE